jgi:hypothetical protein
MPSAECFFKDREDDASQLNRLGVAYFHVCFFSDFCHVLLRLFVGAQLSAFLPSSTQVLAVERNFAFASAQFLAEG